MTLIYGSLFKDGIVTPLNSSSGSNFNFPVTNFGDIIVFSGSDVFLRFGTGSSGQALITDPATATGLNWATVSGGLQTSITGATNFFVTNLLKVSGAISNPTGFLVLSSTVGSVVYVSGALSASDKNTTFNNLSPLLFNGDVLVFSGSSNIRKASGSSGQVLTSDATAPGGLKWADPTSGFNDDRYVLTSSYGPFTASINSVTQSLNGFTASFTSSVQSIGDARWLLLSVYNPFSASLNSFSASINTFTSSVNSLTQSLNGFTSSFTGSVQSIGDTRWTLLSVFNPFSASLNAFSASVNIFTASINLFSQSINTFTSSFSSSINSLIDLRSVLTSSATEQRVQSDLLISGTLRIRDGITAYSQHLILSSSAGSTVVVSGALNASSLSAGAGTVLGGILINQAATAGVGSDGLRVGSGVSVLLKNDTSHSSTTEISMKRIAGQTSTIQFSGSSGSVNLSCLNGSLILSSSFNSIVYISGSLNALDKTTSFDNLSPTTTNGDLIARSGSVNIRIASGTNNTVLTADATVPGGVKWSTPVAGAVNIKEVEVFFTGTGGYGSRYYSGSVTDVDVSAGSQIIAMQSYASGTGKSLDEGQMDAILWRATPLAAGGAFYLFGTTLEGPVSGSFKLNYLIG